MGKNALDDKFAAIAERWKHRGTSHLYFVRTVNDNWLGSQTKHGPPTFSLKRWKVKPKLMS